MSELKECPKKSGTAIINTCNRIPEEVWIDDEDFELVSKHKWYKYPSCRYVRTYIDGKAVSIHRLVMGASASQSIDHINGNSLDNRKCNLRFCSQAENMKNRKPNRKGRSPYKGVVVLKNGRFRAKIDSDGKRVELGVYSYERDAVIAYNAAAKVLHGKFAYMNELPPASSDPTLPPVSPEDLVEGEWYVVRETPRETPDWDEILKAEVSPEYYGGGLGFSIGYTSESPDDWIMPKDCYAIYGPLRFKIGGAE